MALTENVFEAEDISTFVEKFLSLPEPYPFRPLPILGPLQQQRLRAIEEDPVEIFALLSTENSALSQSHIAWFLSRKKDGWERHALLDLSDQYLREAELKPEDPLQERRQVLNFILRLNTLVGSDHDFVKAGILLDEIWTSQGLNLVITPDIAYPLFNVALVAYTELNQPDRCQVLVQQFMSSPSPIRGAQRGLAMLSLAVYLGKQQDVETMKDLLEISEVYLSQTHEGGADQLMGIDVPIAFAQVELLCAWDKQDPRYETQRAEILAQWESKKLPQPESTVIKAKLLVSEGRTARDREKLNEGLMLYKSISLDFHVAETQLIILELFSGQLDEIERYDLLFESWPVLERKLGGRGVTVFVEHLDRANTQAQSTSKQVFGGTVRFRPVSTLPDYINSLARAVFNYFYEAGDDAVAPLQRGLNAFTSYFSDKDKADLESKQAYLLEALDSDDELALEEALKTTFSLTEVERVFGTSKNFCKNTTEGLITTAFETGESQQVQNLALLSESEKLELWRQVVFVPDSDKKGGWWLKTNKDSVMTDQEIKLLEGLLQSEEPSKFKISRLVMQPRIDKIHWIEVSDFPERYLGDVQSTYVRIFGAPPNPDKGYWVTMLDARKELLVASAVAPYEIGMPPDLFTGCPNQAVFESALYEALVKKGFDPLPKERIIEKSVDMGTFAPRPPLDTAQAPVAVHFAAQESHKTWGSAYIIMLGHVMIIRSLRQAGIGFAEAVLPEDQILSVQARDEKIKREMGVTEESLTKVKKNYIDNKGLKPKILIVPIEPLLS